MSRFIASLLFAAVAAARPVAAVELEFTADAAPPREPASLRSGGAEAPDTSAPRAGQVAPTGATCFTDTTQDDFQAGTLDHLDAIRAPGSLQLARLVGVDQQNETVGTSGVGITVTTWGGQTFTPSATGTLVSVDVNLFCSGCTGTTPNLTLGLRATSGGLPTGADLASATVTGFNAGFSAFYTATFASPPTLTAGTQYAFVIRPTANPSPGTYALTRSGTATAGSDEYAGGTRVAGATSGTIWSIPQTGGITTDAGFRIHLDTGFAASGTAESVVRDSGIASSGATAWTTLGFTASTPAGTSVRFQVAASHAVDGPFSPVGPDGTPATFFTTSGASLAQFNGYRYLRYRAVLSTSDGATTPMLDDVTLCHRPLGPPDLRLSKSDGDAVVAPGGVVAYVLDYANDGEQPASGVTLTETVPAFTSFTAGASTAGWSCSPDGTAGSTCTLALGALSAGATGSATFGVTVNSPLPPSVAQVANTASIADDGSHGADPTPGNNTASDTTPITGADLSITKDDGVTSVVAGGSVTYTIVAANAGPNPVVGALVNDTFPAVEACTWTCTGSGGGTCTSSGSGHIADTIALPVGASSTYTVACSVSPGATGTLSNTATIAAPAGVDDPVPANNAATDVDTITAHADVAITMSDDREFVQVGDGVDYRIEVTNPTGPSTAIVAVSDVLPANLDGGAWVCAAGAGATCADGSGNALADVAQIPPGGQVTYLYSATVIAADADDRVVNTASVALTNATDPTPADNSATDSDVVVIFRDGFEPASVLVLPIGGDGDRVAVSLALDEYLVAGLGVGPVTVARGIGVDGHDLFAVEMAHIGHAVAMRVVTRDAAHSAERSAWQPVVAWDRLLAVAWQPADGAGEGRLGIDVGGVPVVSATHGRTDRLVRLVVATQFGTPWLVRMAP